MSYKIGLILSMIFVSLFFAFGVDLLNIQFTYSDLDAKSTAISYQIAEHGLLDDDFIKNIESRYKVSFKCTDYCSPLFGDVVTYTLTKEIKTIVVSQGPMNISISRNAVIGFFE